ncbi:MAG: HNH endonuclease, partial [Vicinamibacteria bacterium]
LLEFHHVDPYALGGPATAENIQLRCRAHNRYEVQLVFGPRPISAER